MCECGIEVEADDLVCPKCQANKSSWTMGVEQTRTFRISGRRVVYLTGIDGESKPPDDPAWASPVLVPAQAAFPLPVEEARAAAEKGHLPPSRAVLVARLFPKKHKDWTVEVEVEFTSAEVAEQEALPADDAEIGEEGFVDVRLVFVVGEGAAEVEFPGATTVDVTEDTELGHAPEVTLGALGKPTTTLPLRSSVVPRFVIASREETEAESEGERPPVRNCYVKVWPLEAGPPERVFWVGDEGRAEPLDSGELVDGARYHLHWRYLEIDPEEEIGEHERQEITAAAEVPLLPRRGKGKVALRLVRSVSAVPDEEPEEEEGDEIPVEDQDRFEHEGAGGADDQEDDEDETEGQTEEPVATRGEGIDEPLGNADYTLEGEGESFQGTTDAEGLLEHEPALLGVYILEVVGARLVVNALHVDAQPQTVLIVSEEADGSAEEEADGADAEEAAEEPPPSFALAEVEAWEQDWQDPFVSYWPDSEGAFS
jgi:hypothetical protein